MSCHTRPKSLSHPAHAGPTTWDCCCCSGCCVGVAAAAAAVCSCQRLLLGLPRGFHCVPGAYWWSRLSGSHPSHLGHWRGCCCCCCAAAGWPSVGWTSCSSCGFGQDTPGTCGNHATVWIIATIPVRTIARFRQTWLDQQHVTCCHISSPGRCRRFPALICPAGEFSGPEITTSLLCMPSTSTGNCLPRHIQSSARWVATATHQLPPKCTSRRDSCIPGNSTHKQ